jgi:hypothetical protein
MRYSGVTRPRYTRMQSGMRADCMSTGCAVLGRARLVRIRLTSSPWREWPATRKPVQPATTNPRCPAPSRHEIPAASVQFQAAGQAAGRVPVQRLQSVGRIFLILHRVPQLLHSHPYQPGDDVPSEHVAWLGQRTVYRVVHQHLTAAHCVKGVGR